MILADTLQAPDRYGVREDNLRVFESALLGTLEEALGPAWGPDPDRVWRAAFAAVRAAVGPQLVRPAAAATPRQAADSDAAAAAAVNASSASAADPSSAA